MASRAIDLAVTTRTALEALPGSLAVSKEPERGRIVISGGRDPGPGQAEIRVALSAEDAGLVTVRTLAITTEGVPRVADHEVRRMIPAADLRLVAFHAEAIDVTRLARCRVGRR
jgi:hypothetical protein